MRNERGTLSRSDVFKVMRWLEAHRDVIGSRGLNARQIAPMIAKDLGLSVSDYTVRSIAKDAGIPLPRSFAGSMSREKQDRVRTLGFVCLHLISVIQKMQAGLGERPSEELESMRLLAQAVSNGRPIPEPTK